MSGNTKAKSRPEDRDERRLADPSLSRLSGVYPCPDNAPLDNIKSVAAPDRSIEIVDKRAVRGEDIDCVTIGRGRDIVGCTTGRSARQRSPERRRAGRTSGGLQQANHSTEWSMSEAKAETPQSP